MKRKTDGKRAEITSLSILPGTLCLAGVLILLFLIPVILFHRAGMLSLPPFLEAIFGTRDDDSEKEGFRESFLASLRGDVLETESSEWELLDMSEDALLELLLTAKPLTNYCLSADISWTNGTTSFTKAEVLCLVADGRTYIESYSSGHATRKFITADATRIYLREGDTARIFPRDADNPTFTPESEAGIPSLARVQSLIAAADAGTYTLSLETALDSPCIRVTLTDPTSGVSEMFEILPDCGLILNAASQLPGETVPYYQMRTISVITNVDGFDPALFEIPEK